jgi:hypothetical protein
MITVKVIIQALVTPFIIKGAGRPLLAPANKEAYHPMLKIVNRNPLDISLLSHQSVPDIPHPLEEKSDLSRR